MPKEPNPAAKMLLSAALRITGPRELTLGLENDKFCIPLLSLDLNKGLRLHVSPQAVLLTTKRSNANNPRIVDRGSNRTTHRNDAEAFFDHSYTATVESLT